MQPKTDVDGSKAMLPGRCTTVQKIYGHQSQQHNINDGGSNQEPRPQLRLAEEIPCAQASGDGSPEGDFTGNDQARIMAGSLSRVD